MQAYVKDGTKFTQVTPGVYLVTTKASKGRSSGAVVREGNHRHRWSFVTASGVKSTRHFRTMSAAANAITHR